MATRAQQQEADDAKQAPAATIPVLGLNQARIDDELKDRERLRKERVEFDEGKITELKAERDRLVDEFNNDTHKRYTEYLARKAELDKQLGLAGANLPNPVPSPMPTNETLEDGTPRYRLNLAKA